MLSRAYHHFTDCRYKLNAGEVLLRVRTKPFGLGSIDVAVAVDKINSQIGAVYLGGCVTRGRDSLRGSRARRLEATQAQGTLVVEFLEKSCLPGPKRIRT